MYKDLNLRDGATLEEIKAAYRTMAKNHHPDSVSAKGNVSVEKFQRAYQAYKSLLKDALDGKTSPESTPKVEEGLTPYVFSGKRESGLDIHYDIILEKPEPLRELKISLPLTRREACPRCLGQGVTLVRKGNGFVYKSVSCERCEGKGVVESESQVEIVLSLEMLRQGKVRLRNAGLYLPKEGKRGDLILHLEYVARLPHNN
jgi:DnaJ-class molecular chaperone